MLTYQGFIIDLDGTVYRGSRLIDGAAEAVRRLTAEGKRVVYLSNRGNISRRMCRDKLLAMGLEVERESILLTSTVTAHYLNANHPGEPVWLLGEQGLREELAELGVPMAESPESAAWLVITLHETLTYHDLNQAFRAVRHGARIIATNADRMVPTESGDDIDVAGMIGAIAYATGREPEVVIGKPSSLMAQAALDALGLPPERCLVVGDSLASDIALARRHGMSSALVLTGSAVREDVAASEYRPDYIWTSIADVLQTDAQAIGKKEQTVGEDELA